MARSSNGWFETRSAGVLAHVSSLPGEHGIGNLGRGARRFVDALAAAGVRYWQICPLGPTGYGDSPYQTFSGRAGNPYFIDLEELSHAGLLSASDLEPLRRLPSEHVDYGGLYEAFWGVLRRAYDSFEARGMEGLEGLDSFVAFRSEQGEWLEAFGAFMALKAHFGGRAWSHWPDEHRRWDPHVFKRLPEAVRRDATRHAFYQYVFFGQWGRLRRYAASRGVGIIGDVPIFVAMDSADTWQSPSVFQLDGRGNPRVVAGVPPDYFSATGQLWGNPLYDWQYLERTGYAWWIDRLRATFDLYDVVRLDHFRGFDTFWEIPAGAKDACGGSWRSGPGLGFFKAVERALPGSRIIAEDLGYIGPNVVALREAAGFPGMKILQFGYGHDAGNVNLPHLYQPNTVVYTGTHDNVTARGWLEQLSEEAATQVDDYFQLGGSRSAWPLIRAALATVSRMAVIPMQDLLDLPAACTLNRPGTSEGNWRWRFTEEQLDAFVQEGLPRLRHWIEMYDRKGTQAAREFSEAPAAAVGALHT